MFKGSGGWSSVSPPRPWFSPRPVPVGFVVDKMAPGQVFLWIRRFPPVSILTPTLNTYFRLNTRGQSPKTFTQSLFLGHRVSGGQKVLSRPPEFQKVNNPLTDQFQPLTPTFFSFNPTKNSSKFSSSSTYYSQQTCALYPGDNRWNAEQGQTLPYLIFVVFLSNPITYLNSPWDCPNTLHFPPSH